MGKLVDGAKGEERYWGWHAMHPVPFVGKYGKLDRNEWVAHVVAKYALQVDSLTIWRDYFPDWIARENSYDCELLFPTLMNKMIVTDWKKI